MNQYVPTPYEKEQNQNWVPHRFYTLFSLKEETMNKGTPIFTTGYQIWESQKSNLLILL